MLRKAFKNRSFEYFGFQEKQLKTLGLKLSTNNKSKFITKPIKFWFLFLNLMTVKLFVVVHVIKNYEYIEDIAESLVQLMIATLLFIKLLLFSFRQRSFQTLKSQLENLLSEANLVEKFIWQQNSDKGQMLLAGFYYLLCASGAGVLSRPLLACLANYVLKGTIELEVPIKAAYPYDCYHPMGYIVTYLICGLGVTFTIAVISLLDGVYCYLIYAVSAHFAIIRQKLKQLGMKMRLSKSLKHYEYEFKRIIAYHQRLFDLTAAFNKIYGWITFMQITICTLQFCFVILLWNTNIDFLVRVHLMIMAATMILQIGIYCFGGEKVQNECEETSNEIYMSLPIEYVEPKMRRLYICFLMRSQMSVTLKCGGYFTTNRILFVAILKTAYSYAAFVSAKN